MNKLTSPKTIALTFGVLVLCFLAVFYVVAWTEPTVAPPGDNVSAPLNVSDTPQTKEGALTIEAGGGESLILKNGGDIRIYNPDNSGSALLYVDSDGEITTQGNLKVGTVTIKGDGSESSNLNSERLQGYHAEELMAAAGGGSYKECFYEAQQANVDCPVGWTAVLSTKGLGCQGDSLSNARVLSGGIGWWLIGHVVESGWNYYKHEQILFRALNGEGQFVDTELERVLCEHITCTGGEDSECTDLIPDNSTVQVCCR